MPAIDTGISGDTIMADDPDQLILRPASDKRGYRYFVLNNGLRCCVISDPCDDDDESDDESQEDAMEQDTHSHGIVFWSKEWDFFCMG